MTRTYHHPLDILQFALRQHGSGRKIALCCLSRVHGGTIRDAGSLLCVADDGSSAGYLSGGCVDADIILQATDAIESGKRLDLIYGEGSPYSDIRLPCGGSIEIAVLPSPLPAMISDVAQRLSQRQAVDMVLDDTGLYPAPDAHTVSFTYLPKLRLRIAGRGEPVKQLAHLAHQSGLHVCVQSPDDVLLKMDFADETTLLTTPDALPANEDDTWTAFALMFHDHDWEPFLLRQALTGDAFYVGAMGSTRTHDLRKTALRDMGLPQSDIDRIHAPLGLVPGSRDAAHLAVSALAEIISSFSKDAS